MVSVQAKRCNTLMSIFVQDYGDEPPLFNDKEKQKAVSQLQTQRAKQTMSLMVIALYRERLKREHAYEGSKLALMDEYEVRLSGLSSDPFLVGLMKVSRARSASAPSDKRTKVAAPRAKRKKAGADVNDDDDFQMTGTIDKDAPLRRSARNQNKGK